MSDLMETVKPLTDEIERLRAENSILRRDFNEQGEIIAWLYAKVAELKSENKELDDLNYIQAGMIAEAGLAALEGDDDANP